MTEHLTPFAPESAGDDVDDLPNGCNGMERLIKALEEIASTRTFLTQSEMWGIADTALREYGRLTPLQADAAGSRLEEEEARP